MEQTKASIQQSRNRVTRVDTVLVGRWVSWPSVGVAQYQLLLYTYTHLTPNQCGIGGVKTETCNCEGAESIYGFSFKGVLLGNP
mmetsp:Transcript_108545/g.187636  ORF Transcript_108545/g.187636 Transcript_108545/m.187636 type:complete len:84 (-) Transcript_108545:91-342(-)